MFYLTSNGDQEALGFGPFGCRDGFPRRPRRDPSGLDGIAAVRRQHDPLDSTELRQCVQTPSAHEIVRRASQTMAPVRRANSTNSVQFTSVKKSPRPFGRAMMPLTEMDSNKVTFMPQRYSVCAPVLFAVAALRAD